MTQICFCFFLHTGNGSDYLKLKDEELEEIVMLKQQVSSEMESNFNDKGDSLDHLSHTLDIVGDDLNYFDMEDLVNGKLLGNGALMGDNKTGANITSIYSKRSSPVNVNMLNHIYAPGLPLPRRLTESVQRLVKPLPASETSMPQTRHCKSPGVVSPRVASGINGPLSSRMSLHSGTRSPGASVPKLIPNDKHLLLTGGLDLAGISSSTFQQGLQSSDFHLSGNLPAYTNASPQNTGDFPLQDPSLLSLSSSTHMSSSVDIVTHVQKALSQSYPPHKVRDPLTNLAIYDLFSHVQPSIPEGEDLNLPVTSNTSKLDLNMINTSNKNCDLGPSHRMSHSQVWINVNRQLNFKEGALKNHLSQTLSSFSPLNSYSSSSSPSSSLPSSDSRSRTGEKVSHSMNSFAEVVPSSPEHSKTIMSTALSVENKDLTDHVLPISSIQSSQASSVSYPSVPRKPVLSTSDSSSSSPMTMSRNNVPYHTNSSGLVTSSLVSSAGGLIPRMSPSMSKVLLSTTTSSSMGMHNVAVKPENGSLPHKSELSSSRPVGVASSPVRRNLFDSVSGDLNRGSLVSSHASLCRTLDVTIPQFQNSVLDNCNQSLKTLEDTFPSPPDNETLDFVSLQSIQTNETPSTSLPAQVVHLDFPHYSSPTTSLCASSINPELPKHPKATIPVSQQAFLASNKSKWAMPGKNTSLMPMKETFDLAREPINKISSITSTSTAVTSSCRTSPKISRDKHSPQTTPVKEPILEKMALTLTPATNKMNPGNFPLKLESTERKSPSLAAVGMKTVAKTDSLKMETLPTLQDKPPVVHTKLEKSTLPHPHQTVEGLRKECSRKRSTPDSDPEHKDLSLELPAKRHQPDPNQHTALSTAVSTTVIGSVSVTASVIEGTKSDEALSKTEKTSEVIKRTGVVEEEDNGNQKENINISSGSVMPAPQLEMSESPTAVNSSVGIVESHERKVDVKDVTLSKPEMLEETRSVIEARDFVKEVSSDTQSEPEIAKNTSMSEIVTHEFPIQIVDKTKHVVSGEVSNPQSNDQGMALINARTHSNEQPLDEDRSKSHEMGFEAKEDPVTSPVIDLPGGQSVAATNSNAMDLKQEDSSKKGRVKRQFYAYVPEKSIDQSKL